MSKQQPAWRVALNYYIGGLIMAKIIIYLLLKITLPVLGGVLPFWVNSISDLCLVILAAYFGAWYINSRYIFIKNDVLRWSLYYYTVINVILIYAYVGFMLAVASRARLILSLEFIGPLLITIFFSIIYYFAGKKFVKAPIIQNNA